MGSDYKPLKMLFLDDERMPEDVTWITMYPGHYDIVRSFDEFRAYIKANGIPNIISFDNDLGGWREGYHCADWLVGQFLFEGMNLPEEFDFTVHTMNPIARKRIHDVLMYGLQEYSLTL